MKPIEQGWTTNVEEGKKTSYGKRNMLGINSQNLVHGRWWDI